MLYDNIDCNGHLSTIKYMVLIWPTFSPDISNQKQFISDRYISPVYNILAWFALEYKLESSNQIDFLDRYISPI